MPRAGQDLQAAYEDSRARVAFLEDVYNVLAEDQVATEKELHESAALNDQLRDELAFAETRRDGAEAFARGAGEVWDRAALAEADADTARGLLAAQKQLTEQESDKADTLYGALLHEAQRHREREGDLQRELLEQKRLNAELRSDLDAQQAGHCAGLTAKETEHQRALQQKDTYYQEQKAYWEKNAHERRGALQQLEKQVKNLQERARPSRWCPRCEARLEAEAKDAAETKKQKR